jgi:hypothetical protein
MVSLIDLLKSDDPVPAEVDAALAEVMRLWPSEGPNGAGAFHTS